MKPRRKAISLRVDTDAYEELRALSQEMHIPMSEMVRWGMRQAAKRYKDLNEQFKELDREDKRGA